jgi:cold shock CspA family protein
MNGIITSLGEGQTVGIITGENGGAVTFKPSELLQYDAARLTVGQLVTFDIEQGNSPKAKNVCVRKQCSPATGIEKGAFLRYMGFEQSGAIRSYHFTRISLGDDRRTFVVTTDLTLFRKYGIGIQEGPAMCLRLLQEQGAMDPVERPIDRSSLTDREMVALLASRPAPPPRHAPKRPVQPPAQPPSMPVGSFVGRW